MTTDNRTNEPTLEQVEAAAKAMFEEEKGQTLNGEIWPNWEDLCRCNLNDRMCTHGGKQLPYLLLARAALEAAQGAGTQPNVAQQIKDMGIERVREEIQARRDARRSRKGS